MRGAELRALAARDLAAFATLVHPGFELPAHLAALASKLEAVESGRLRRLLVCMPPRHGKSLLASAIFPAWFVAKRPYRQVIFATYAADFAEDFGRKVRNHLAGDRCRSVFPAAQLSDDSAAA
ncbi:MAG TPA: hypothetical protein VMQ61_10510, partial [Thermoanaerobaculia bacterium]|nr:hypothetical protein [Thermoanaerobaculia bacterium]